MSALTRMEPTPEQRKANRRLALGIFVFAVLLMTLVLYWMLRTKYP